MFLKQCLETQIFKAIQTWGHGKWHFNLRNVYMISISNTYFLLVCPLLGLEPPTTENTEELDPKPEADSFESSLNPLLGTRYPTANVC